MDKSRGFRYDPSMRDPLREVERYQQLLRQAGVRLSFKPPDSPAALSTRALIRGLAAEVAFWGRRVSRQGAR
jgi:hypothetical protein